MKNKIRILRFFLARKRGEKSCNFVTVTDSLRKHYILRLQMTVTNRVKSVTKGLKIVTGAEKRIIYG